MEKGQSGQDMDRKKTIIVLVAFVGQTVSLPGMIEANAFSNGRLTVCPTSATISGACPHARRESKSFRLNCM